MATLNFNANAVDPSADFEAIPANKYLAVITESEVKKTKAGSGTYLQLTFQILEGQYKGRILWARLNLNNPNATAVQIARGELSAICRAVGVMTPQDSSELHNVPLIITVKLKKRPDTNDLTNEIKGYAPRLKLSGGSEAPPAPTGAQNPAPAPAPAANSPAPWKR